MMADVDSKPIPQKIGVVQNEYSMTTLGNVAVKKAGLQQEVNQDSRNPHNDARDKNAKKLTPYEGVSYKWLACIFAAIAAVAIVACIVCIVYFAVEIAELNAQTATTRQSPSGQQMEVNSSFVLKLLQQMQQNVSDAIEAVSNSILRLPLFIHLTTGKSSSTCPSTNSTNK